MSWYTQVAGNIPVVGNAAYGGSAGKNSYLNGTVNQGFTMDRALEAAGIWFSKGGLLSPIDSTMQAAQYFGATMAQDISVGLVGNARYLLETPGFITPGTEWGRIMNQSIERDGLTGEDLIRDEFGPAAAKDFGSLPAAAQRMMIFQAELNKADRVNKASTERIQRINGMLMDIIRNFKG